MRASIVIVIACLAAAVVAGCGGKDSSTPVACLEGPSTYMRALEAAPGEVKLAGESPIGDCLAENQQGGDLATVGGAMVAAATRLNAEARAEAGGDAALQLGYLLGAAQRGADSTEGIHADLIRRLTVAARYAPGSEPLPPAFIRAYQEGFDAGHSHG
jgi:hypothetical protein